ncbi:hypothetical protein TSACC_21140 [Terrimicrobium sacchariphilum]|uniref:Histidine phosphatase family protein n=1 Tax=Terrimicrobium sacchariphilum TaxID=690879 RepID=A0A146G4L3_TERSA|nr:histidine phosphatase family protein [Terrimicrobium sacchariphilum]GAT32739.1 hypothetical protein TSACC_21140 [Terrimicrobium sacchariphilum]
MKQRCAVFLVVLLVFGGLAQAQTEVQKLVFVRHGERPPGGHGQIMEQGLLRSLALPDVLIGKFGKPAYIFAPSPLAKVKELDTGLHYYYLRPLATIEPTAIRCGLPVNVRIGYTDIGALRRELSKPKYWNSTVFVAWEHLEICKVVREFLKKYGGNPNEVPTWSNTDYDSIFVLTITRQQGKVVSIAFAHEHEGLNGLKPSQVKLIVSPSR